MELAAGSATMRKRHVPHGLPASTAIPVYRAIVLDENAVNTLIRAYAVAVDRRGVEAWPS